LNEKPEGWLDDINSQIIEVSNIASKKHGWAKKVLICSGATAVLIFLFIVSQGFSI